MPTFTFQTGLPLPLSTEDLHKKVRYFTAIKDAIDRELAVLIGARQDFEPGKPWHCVRCDYTWLSRLPHRPKRCPQCRIMKFDSPPLYTYAERAARKQARVQVDRKPSDWPVESVPSLPHSVVTRSVAPVMEQDVASVTLTPPPAAPPVMSLRERLAQMNAAKPQSNPGSYSVDEGVRWKPIVDPQPVEQPQDLGIMEAVSTDDELVEAINGEPDAT